MSDKALPTDGAGQPHDRTRRSKGVAKIHHHEEFVFDDEDATLVQTSLPIRRVPLTVFSETGRLMEQ